MTSQNTTSHQNKRMERVNSYRNLHDDQFKFYEDKSACNKLLFSGISIAIIILGALITFIPVLELGDQSVKEILAGFGALIVILKGIERVWLPEEKWTNYRKAAEAMRRESQLYVENIAPYADQNEEDAYSLFVIRCVKIQAEEQSNFWGMDSQKRLK